MIVGGFRAVALVGTIRLSSFCTQGGERQIGVMKNANIYIYIHITRCRGNMHQFSASMSASSSWRFRKLVWAVFACYFSDLRGFLVSERSINKIKSVQKKLGS